MLFPTDELWPVSERSVAQHYHYDLNIFLQDHSSACDCIKSWCALIGQQLTRLSYIKHGALRRREARKNRSSYLVHHIRHLGKRSPSDKPQTSVKLPDGAVRLHP